MFIVQTTFAVANANEKKEEEEERQQWQIHYTNSTCKNCILISKKITTTTKPTNTKKQLAQKENARRENNYHLHDVQYAN